MLLLMMIIITIINQPSSSSTIIITTRILTATPSTPSPLSFGYSTSPSSTIFIKLAGVAGDSSSISSSS